MSFWLNHPTILLRKDKLTEIWPQENDNFSEQLNAMTRFIILVSVLGFILLKHYLILVLGIIIVGLIALYYHHSNKEGYLNHSYNDYRTGSVINDSKYIESNNPLGNTLMNDYVDEPNKEDSIDKLPLEANPTYGKTPSYETNYNEITENNISEKTKEFIYENNKDNKDIQKLFTSLGDQMNFDKQMRQFHTMPNTTIPNDQSSFLTYCYGNLPSDKNVISY
tara:strand:+ start:21 stop:686 length:666 start_codon:yes stop_codon:yes gene_type:complete